MTKKQLKTLATQLAKNEYIIQTSDNSYEVNEAKDAIMDLNMRYELELDDMLKLDEMVQEILAKKLAN